MGAKLMRLMTNIWPIMRITSVLIVATLGAVTSTGAQQAGGKHDGDGPRRGLAPEHLQVVRAVSQNVLMAKARSTADLFDNQRLERLRATINQLLAAEFDPQNQGLVTVEGQETKDQRKSRSVIAERRAKAHADGREVSREIRERARRNGSRAQGGQTTDAVSGGYSVEHQRARLFERWADKLDAALADNNPERVPQLLALRGQLQPNKGGLIDAPLTYSTPTLQAMPWDGAPQPRVAE